MLAAISSSSQGRMSRLNVKVKCNGNVITFSENYNTYYY